VRKLYTFSIFLRITQKNIPTTPMPDQQIVSIYQFTVNFKNHQNGTHIVINVCHPYFIFTPSTFFPFRESTMSHGWIFRSPQVHTLNLTTAIPLILVLRTSRSYGYAGTKWIKKEKDFNLLGHLRRDLGKGKKVKSSPYVELLDSAPAPTSPPATKSPAT
jgi:hypothetical protein